MPASVPTRFAFPSRAGVASRKPVRGATHASLARAMNYLRGHSRVLLPATTLAHNFTGTGTYTLGVPMTLGPWVTHLEWFVRFRATSGVVTVSFVDPSGGSSTHVVGAMDADAHVRVSGIRHIETLASRVDTGALAVVREVDIAKVTSGSLFIESISCRAVSRYDLAFDGDDMGVDAVTLRADLPIFDADYRSLGGLVRSMRDQDDAADHGYTDRHLFWWGAPHDEGVEFASGSWTPVFDEGPVIQASHRYIGETERVVKVMAGGTCDELEVRFTAASGDSATVTIPDLTPGTWSDPADLVVTAEDLSTSDGRRGALDEIVTIEARAIGSPNYLEGLCIYESREAT